MTPWGYERENGPTEWSQWFPLAKEGVRQSPIDIGESDCEDGDGLPDLNPQYTPVEGLTIQNTGASWKVDCVPEKSDLAGGPLGDKYKLLQMHAHWGNRRGRGSEHTIGGKSYDGELHLVHYNSKYGAPENAMDKPDGLAVIGVFLKVGDKDHPEFKKITDALENVQLKDDTAKLSTALDPSKLLPVSDTYFTYDGSLTTPPLYESVTFLIYKEPIIISRSQMSKMRNMKSGTDKVAWDEKDNTDDEESGDELQKESAKPGCLFNNYRPVCGNAKGRCVRRVRVK